MQILCSELYTWLLSTFALKLVITMIRRLRIDMTSLFPGEKKKNTTHVFAEIVLRRELHMTSFLQCVIYVFVTLTFWDPVQVDEHRMQHRLLALGVITLILGHNLDAIHSTTTTTVTLFKDSGAPFCSNQLDLLASTAVWRPWGLHSGFFTYSIT